MKLWDAAVVREKFACGEISRPTDPVTDSRLERAPGTRSTPFDEGQGGLAENDDWGVTTWPAIVHVLVYSAIINRW